jgi:hypothetical protein
MDEAQHKELEALLALGKHNKSVPEYSRFYTMITGQRRHSGCSSCEANFLFAYLCSYISSINKNKK